MSQYGLTYGDFIKIRHRSISYQSAPQNHGHPGCRRIVDDESIVRPIDDFQVCSLCQVTYTIKQVVTRLDFIFLNFQHVPEKRDRGRRGELGPVSIGFCDGFLDPIRGFDRPLTIGTTWVFVSEMLIQKVDDGVKIVSASLGRRMRVEAADLPFRIPHTTGKRKIQLEATGMRMSSDQYG